MYSFSLTISFSYIEKKNPNRTKQLIILTFPIYLMCLNTKEQMNSGCVQYVSLMQIILKLWEVKEFQKKAVLYLVFCAYKDGA